MSKRFGSTGALVLMAALGTTTVARATTAVHLSDANMVAQSDSIVTGECVGRESRWIDQQLVTVVTVAVSETLKGEEAATIEVVLPGGIDMNRKFPVAVTWPGAPTIAEG